MKTRQITLYKEKSFIGQLFADTLKIALGIAIAFVLSQNEWSPTKAVDSISDSIKLAVSQTSNSAKSSVDLTRDLIAKEVMSEESRNAINQLVVNNYEMVTIKEQLAEVQTQNAQMKVALDNALVPEATVKAATMNHVVEPVKDGFVTVKVKVSDIWNAYEFQPSKVKGWVSNVF